MLNVRSILGWGIAAVVAGVLFVNAAFMLASPKAWFRLPGWLRAQGSLNERTYANGWAAIQLRLAGALILAVIAWVGYEMLFAR